MRNIINPKITVLLLFGVIFAFHSSWAGSDSTSVSHNRSFFRQAAPYAMLAAGGGIAFALDKDINRQFYKGRVHGHSADKFFSNVSRFGTIGPYVITFPLLAGYGLLYKDNKSLYAAGELGFGALAAPGATQLIKKIFGRKRPYETDDSWKFFKGGSSFYSGHTITALTYATIISKNYPRQNLGFIGIHENVPVLPVLTYTAAGLVGFQRLYSHNHWASDVYFGALSGYGAGSLIVYLGDRVRSGRLRLSMREPGVLQIAYRFN